MIYSSCNPLYSPMPSYGSYYSPYGSSMYGCCNSFSGGFCSPGYYNPVGSFYGGMRGQMVGSSIGGLIGMGAGFLGGGFFGSAIGGALGAAVGGGIGGALGSFFGGRSNPYCMW